MRVGIDASNLRAGGGLTHLTELLSAASPEVHGITKLIVWGGKRTLEQLPAGKPWLEPVHEPLLDGPLVVRQAWQRWHLKRVVFEKCDLLFSPGGSYPRGVRPVVTMSRNLLPFEPAERRRFGTSWMHAKLKLLEAVQARSLKEADGVIFLSEYARATVLKRTGPLKGLDRIIPHGVGEAFFWPPERRRVEVSGPAPLRFLYVSNVDVYKHQWNVAEAAASLRSTGVNVSVTFVGGSYGPALARLRRTIESLDPDGRFLRYGGPAAYSELPVIYREADAFVFASSCENLPNILLEAMAAALPIACSDRGPMLEVLGEAGVYFHPERPEEIANAMRRIANDPGLRARLSALAHARAASHSWERCASETFEFLAAVAREAGIPEGRMRRRVRWGR